MYEVPDDITKAVDDLMASSGYRREGTNENPFMYFLGLLLRPLDRLDQFCKYRCLANAKCCAAKTEVS